jgi:hypothetical protein
MSVDIYGGDGGIVAAEFPLSQQELEQLNSGRQVVVQYHTPRMMRGGGRGDSGKFTLRKIGERIVTEDVQSLKRCIAILQASGSL